MSFDRGPGSASLDAEQFRSFATFLERMVDDIERRAQACRQTIDEVGHVGTAVTGAWRSPVAETMAGGVTGYVSSATAVAQHTTRSFVGLLVLAAEARRVATVIAEVEQYEKSWNQQLVANWSEWQDRATTTAWGLLPHTDDQPADALNRSYEERTRQTEAASTRRREALARWHGACGSAAASMRAAIAELEGFVASPPPPALVRPAEATVGRLSDGELDALLRSVPEDQRRDLSQIRGRFRAEETKRALRDVGIDPDRFRPEDLRKLDPASPGYRHLVDLLDENARRMDDPAFATGYYDALGVKGIRATIGTLEMMQFHQRHGVDSQGRPVAPLGDRIERTITAHAHGFASATCAPELADDLPVLLDTQNRWQLHQLALLSSGPPGTYDPRFLGDAAYRVLVTRADDNRTLASPIASSETYPPIHAQQPLYSDDRLNLNEAIALHALAGNPAAAWAFAWDGTSVRTDAVATIILFRTPAGGDLGDRTYFRDRGGARSAEHLGALIDGMQHDSLGAIDHVLANAETAGVARHGDAATVYSTAMTVVGDGGASGPAKVRVAGHFGRYIEDMHLAITDQEQTPGVARGTFERPAMVRYFAETLDDPDAAAAIGFHFTQYASSRSQDFLYPSDTTRYAEAQGRFIAVERIAGALLDGAELSDTRAEESLAAAGLGAHAALDFTVEGGLMFLPGAAGPPAEIIKTYGHDFIDKRAEYERPGGDPARMLLHDMTNTVENDFAARVRALAALDPSGPQPPAKSENAVQWWFSSQKSVNPIQPLRKGAIAERDWYGDDGNWDHRVDGER